MKRKVKTERIIILLLSAIIIVQTVFLLVVLCSNKNSKTCSSSNKLTNTDEVVCGDDSDIARFMCNRYHEEGYIITFKDNIEENVKRDIMNRLVSTLPGTPIIYVDKIDINNLLRNIYGLQTEKDFEIDSFLFVYKSNNDKSELEKQIKGIKELDKIISFKVEN